MSPRTRRVLFWLPLLLVLAGGIAFLLRPRPVPVETATVRRAPLVVAVEEEGRTRAKEVYRVLAPVAGRLRRISLDPGDPVRAGETVLARIEPTHPAFLDIRTRRELEAEVKRAEAAVSMAEAERDKVRAALDYARAELERSRRLVTKNYLAASVLDRAEMEYRTRLAELRAAEALVEQRRFELETARARLIGPPAQVDGGLAKKGCCIELRAPASGSVFRVLRRDAGAVEAGAPLLELGDPHDLEVVVDVLSRDGARIAAGAPVRLTEWGGEGALRGRVRRVEPAGYTKVSALGIEEQRVDVLIDFTEPPPAQLGHGFRVMAAITVWSGEDVLQVPAGALFRRGADWMVFVIEDGRARLRRLRIGRRNPGAAQVLGGLAAGEQVILFPSDRIADGVEVRPMPSG